MSSLHRTLEGDVLLHHLADDESLIDPDLLSRHGRSARTLVKSGPLRVTVLGMAAGARLARHHAEGPVTIQVLSGSALVEVPGREYPVVAGDLLVLDAGVEHAVRSRADTRLLLTVVHAPAAPHEAPASG